MREEGGGREKEKKNYSSPKLAGGAGELWEARKD